MLRFKVSECNGKSICNKGEERYDPGSFDRQSERPLMLGTGSGDASGKDLSPFGNKAMQRIGVFVINFHLLKTELADLLLEENFAFTAPAIITVTPVHLRISAILPVAIEPFPIGPGWSFTVFRIFFIRHKKPHFCVRPTGPGTLCSSI